MVKRSYYFFTCCLSALNADVNVTETPSRTAYRLRHGNLLSLSDDHFFYGYYENAFRAKRTQQVYFLPKIILVDDGMK